MESELNGSGIQFAVEYLGNVPIDLSIQEMPTDIRVLVVRECIYMVADALNLVQKRDSNKVALRLIGDGQPTLKNIAVDFNVSSKQFRILKDGILARNPLSHVSFAAQGKDETEGMVGYVAKKVDGSDRRCYILKFAEAQKLMNTIHEAMSLYAQSQGIPIVLSGPSCSALLPAPAPSVYRDVPYLPEIDVVTANVRILEHQPWYHGVLSRNHAEVSLKEDGDFLVRQSTNSPGQIILSGREGRVVKHVHLLDNNRVRTRDREFVTVLELINYHIETGQPIVSEESHLKLKKAVARQF